MLEKERPDSSEERQTPGPLVSRKAVIRALRTNNLLSTQERGLIETVNSLPPESTLDVDGEARETLKRANEEAAAIRSAAEVDAKGIREDVLDIWNGGAVEARKKAEEMKRNLKEKLEGNIPVGPFENVEEARDFLRLNCDSLENAVEGLDETIRSLCEEDADFLLTVNTGQALAEEIMRRLFGVTRLEDLSALERHDIDVAIKEVNPKAFSALELPPGFLDNLDKLKETSREIKEKLEEWDEPPEE